MKVGDQDTNGSASTTSHGGWCAAALVRPIQRGGLSPLAGLDVLRHWRGAVAESSK
jgi:hypothetical protein